MRASNPDPTAGRTAQAIRLNPGAPRRIGDPMSSRYGNVPLTAGRGTGEEPRIVDPTDPACGKPPT